MSAGSWGRLLPAALALACPAQMVCFAPTIPGVPFASRSATTGVCTHLRPAQLLRKSIATSVSGMWYKQPAIAEYGRALRLTALDLKKGKGTAPNKKAKKGREAYLAAKKALEANQAAPSEGVAAEVQPRPGDDDLWTMEEAWEDHTKELARVMTEAAPDFAQSPAVVEVALGAPEKWWNEVVIPRLARIAKTAFEGMAAPQGDLR